MLFDSEFRLVNGPDAKLGQVYSEVYLFGGPEDFSRALRLAGFPI
jgi:hypothetical protein